MASRSRTLLRAALAGIAVLAVLAASLVVAALFWLRPKPVEGPPRFASHVEAPPPELSVIVLPVTVPLADLAASVEAGLPEVLLSLQGEEVQGGWAVDVQLTRPEPLRVLGRAGRLNLEVPLGLRARAYRARRAERRAEKGKDPPQGLGLAFAAVITLALDLSIDSQWHLGSKTTAALSWVEEPKLDVGPFTIGLRKPIEKQLEAQLSEIGGQVDAQIRAQDTMRANIEQAWADLSEPRQLSVEPPMWFLSEPEALTASDLMVGERSLDLTVGLTGRFRTHVGDPGPAPPRRPLPDRQPPPERSGVRIALPVALGWEALSEAAGAELVGQRWAVSQATLEVRGAELYPSGDAVVAALTYQAESPLWTTDGVLFLSGRPVIDPDVREVRIDDFDYVLETWDPAVAGSNALVESGIEEAVGERLAFAFGPQLDEARAGANRDLASGHSDRKGGTMTGALDAVDIRGLVITEGALVVDAVVTGELSLRVFPRPPPMDRPPVRLPDRRGKGG